MAFENNGLGRPLVRFLAEPARNLGLAGEEPLLTDLEKLSGCVAHYFFDQQPRRSLAAILWSLLTDYRQNRCGRAYGVKFSAVACR